MYPVSAKILNSGLLFLLKIIQIIEEILKRIKNQMVKRQKTNDIINIGNTNKAPSPLQEELCIKL